LVLPHFRGDALEVVRGVDPHALGFWVVFRRGDGQVIAFALEARDRLVQLWAAQQVQVHEALAQRCHLLEERAIRGERHAREVIF